MRIFIKFLILCSMAASTTSQIRSNISSHILKYGLIYYITPDNCVHFPGKSFMSM